MKQKPVLRVEVGACVSIRATDKHSEEVIKCPASGTSLEKQARIKLGSTNNSYFDACVIEDSRDAFSLSFSRSKRRIFSLISGGTNPSFKPERTPEDTP